MKTTIAFLGLLALYGLTACDRRATDNPQPSEPVAKVAAPSSTDSLSNASTPPVAPKASPNFNDSETDVAPPSPTVRSEETRPDALTLQDTRGSTPRQIGVVPQIVPPSKAPRLAPEGFYVLLRPMSVTTDSGIVGLRPGTELQVLRDNGPTLHVLVGGSEFDVPKTAVTNDLDVAEAAFASAPTAKASSTQWKKLPFQGTVTTEAAARAMMTPIVLKDPQNRQEVIAYLNELIGIPMAIFPQRQDGPIAEKYAEVGANNIDLLLQYHDSTANRALMGNHRWGMLGAITKLASERNKQQIVEALPTHKSFIHIVVKFGWENDCRETLLAAMREQIQRGAEGTLPREWTIAVANFKDVTLYPLLSDYVSVCSDKHGNFTEFAKLSGFDRIGVASRAWNDLQTRKDKTGWNFNRELHEFAPDAAENGSRDALFFCFDFLSHPTEVEPSVRSMSPTWERSMKQRLAAILHASDAELAKYASLKDKLVYEPDTRRWVISPSAVKSKE